MTQATPRSALAEPALPTKSWHQWYLKVQAFQVHAASDMLGVFGRYAGALAAARDARAVGEAQQAAVEDWAASMASLQEELARLALVLPPGVLAPLGWRLRRGAEVATQAVGHEPLPGLLEQARLGVEMLMRPWIGAPDLDHTDEFVA